jgi:hypothetical protein
VSARDELRLPWWARLAGLIVALLALVITLPIHAVVTAYDVLRRPFRAR